MSMKLPDCGLQLQSTLHEDGALRLAIVEVPVVPPGPGEALVRVEAAPVNPADVKALLASADPAHGEFGSEVRLPLPPAEAARLHGRLGKPLPTGFGGAGTVLAAGVGAEHLEDKLVSFISRVGAGAFGQYVTVDAGDCASLPEGVSAREGADVLRNPMTALTMIEHVRHKGQNALIHTAAASNIGQMLVRICREDGIGLVNVVRRQEQVDLLKSLGAEHVCNSSASDFAEDLRRAVAATGAVVAFDAIGGGDSADILHRAMEDAGSARPSSFYSAGLAVSKVVYLYGKFDPAPLVLHNGEYGLDWTVRVWDKTHFLAHIGPERVAQMKRRVLDGIRNTFASIFDYEIPLAQALDRETMLKYIKPSTGNKYLINPIL